MSEEYVLNVKDGAIELLNSLTWHDSILYDVRLVRRDSADQVFLDLRVLDDWESYQSRRALLILENCYRVRLDMYWGVKCMSDGEMIADATTQSNDDLIQHIYTTWGNSFKDNPLALFKLDLASTGSVIEVVFQSIRLQYISEPGDHSAPEAYPLDTRS